MIKTSWKLHLMMLFSASCELCTHQILHRYAQVKHKFYLRQLLQELIRMRRGTLAMLCETS